MINKNENNNFKIHENLFILFRELLIEIIIQKTKKIKI